MPDPAPKNPAAPVAKPTGWNRPLAEINATIRKAEGGDKAAFAEVKGMLAAPGCSDFLGGNVAAEVVRLLVKKYAGSNPVIQESVTRKVEELRAELCGPNPTSLEKLLAERVVATWLHLHHLETLFAQKESYTLEVGAYYQKAISAAQKRYLAAIKGLADVRRLALPALQINIAKRQTNVAAGTAVSASDAK